MPQSVMAVDTSRLLVRTLRTMARTDDSPAAKKSKSEKFPLNSCKFATAVAVFFLFTTASEFGRIKLPRTLSDLLLLKENLSEYDEEVKEEEGGGRKGRNRHGSDGDGNGDSDGDSWRREWW